MNKMIWKLKAGSDYRLRMGHPWVFAGDLEHRMHQTEAVFAVELQDSQGKFVAYGYGNPRSQISFRALSWSQADVHFATGNFILSRLLQAWTARFRCGYRDSFRLCYGEADGLPGLVIDSYRVIENHESEFMVLVVQISTAGMQALIPDRLEFFKQLILASHKNHLLDLGLDRTIIVARNDLNIRKMEGLDVQEPEVLWNPMDLDLQKVLTAVRDHRGERLFMACDLLQGQKTGFFLDQAFNIQQVTRLLETLWSVRQPAESIKILDLCCYVGHWSTQIAGLAARMGLSVHVDLVDISKSALSYAAENVQRAAQKSLQHLQSHAVDVMGAKDLFTKDFYDIVIADPPAFIKAKKDIPIGQQAYTKLNNLAFKWAKPSGLVVSCSCSGLLTELDFRECLIKSMVKNKLYHSHCLLKGSPSPDHPHLLSFPDGQYLKMLVHQK